MTPITEAIFYTVFQCDIKDLLNKSHNGPEIISAHSRINPAMTYFFLNSTSICTSGSDGSGTNVMIEEKQMRYRNPPQSILLTFISFTPPFPVGNRLIQV